jgi:hypothetical protein
MTDADDARRWLEELVEKLQRRLRQAEEETDGNSEAEEKPIH